MTGFIGLDFETWAPRSIKEVGLDNYVNQDGFMVLAATMRKLTNKHSDWDGLATERVFDFVMDPAAQTVFLNAYFSDWTQDNRMIAHNSAFEKAVLTWMTPSAAARPILDSAVISRCMGAGSSLHDAARQLLGGSKLGEEGRLLRKFSLSPKPPTWKEVENDPDWKAFVYQYNAQDAYLSALLGIEYYERIQYYAEYQNQAMTDDMNLVGWHVDMDAVHAMKARYEENKRKALEEFRQRYDPQGKLNVNSLPQLKAWCRERGINATSFSEEAVENLQGKISRRLNTAVLDEEQYRKLYEVFTLLDLKQTLGGSSLTKLDRIIDLTSKDGRLRHQYMHCGAGQSYRTSGTGVQMQNLKRLDNEGLDFETIFNDDSEWDNDSLASNLRQVFTATHPQGLLIVGDFKSVESRGLAWLAGETWKIDAYQRGLEVYKMQAAKIYKTSYDDVTRQQRTNGKVGELSCGYGAGPGAVQGFAQKMHIDMSMEDAEQLVYDWRAQCPQTVEMWNKLDEGIHRILEPGVFGVSVWLSSPVDVYVHFDVIPPPQPLLDIHPGTKSVKVSLLVQGKWQLSRVIHGLYQLGRDVCYYKPSKAMHGPAWVSSFVNPKTKQRQRYKIYGGKLTGIIVQSFCREIFFRSLSLLSSALRWETGDSPRIVGQFHDEIVVDWSPDHNLSKHEMIQVMNTCMSTMEPELAGFPLEADIKAAYRYIK